jgi:ankyrin repeat protein
MAAAKRDRDEIVRYLLEKGANPDVISISGFTALDYAILQGNYECAQ